MTKITKRITTHTIKCDGPNCQYALYGTPKLKDEDKKRGWSEKNGKHFCDTHTKYPTFDRLKPKGDGDNTCPWCGARLESATTIKEYGVRCSRWGCGYSKYWDRGHQ